MASSKISDALHSLLKIFFCLILFFFCVVFVLFLTGAEWSSLLGYPTNAVRVGKPDFRWELGRQW